MLLNLKANAQFTIPLRVEGLIIDLGIAVRVFSPCPKLYSVYSSVFL